MNYEKGTAIIVTIFACILFGLGFLCGWICAVNSDSLVVVHESIQRDTITVTIPPEQLNEWEIMTIAIGINESRLDSLAKNPASTASGWLQQLAGYVDDCNEIIPQRGNYKPDGENIYFFSHNDRKYLDKSIIMFNLVQERYNPDMDVVRAIQLHSRGLSSEWDEWAQYSVAEKMRFVRRYEKIRSEIIKLRGLNEELNNK